MIIKRHFASACQTLLSGDSSMLSTRVLFYVTTFTNLILCSCLLLEHETVSARSLSADQLQSIIGGECNDEKSDSHTCTDTTPASCPAGGTTFCATDPNDATKCIKHTKNNFSECRHNLPTTKNWHCTKNLQKDKCITCFRGSKVDGACPESTCKKYGTCGETKQKPTNRSCTGG